MSIGDAWRLTLLEWEAAKSYHFPYILIIGRTFPNPLVEHFLPGVILIKAVAVFDDALEGVIESEYGGLPRGYRQSLEGRLIFLAEKGRLADAESLHDIRRLRNKVSHERNEHLTWDRLETALFKLETALQSLQLVGQRPHLEYFGERSGIQLSTEPGVLGTRTFTIGVRENGAVAYEAAWTETIYRLNPDASGLD